MPYSNSRWFTISPVSLGSTLSAQVSSKPQRPPLPTTPPLPITPHRSVDEPSRVWRVVMVTPLVVDSDGDGVAAVVAWGRGRGALKEKGHFGGFAL